jgi:hypothetical protein
MITQENLNIRLQRLNCCIGNLGGEVQGLIAIGDSCYKEKLAILKVLQGYLEALQCYTLNTNVTTASGSITLDSLFVNDEILQVLADGVPIMEPVTLVFDPIYSFNSIVAAINDYGTYSAEVAIDFKSMIIASTSCDNPTLTFLNPITGVTLSGFEGGLCLENCLTEKQILTMFDKVSEYCNICFPNSEYTFIK